MQHYQVRFVRDSDLPEGVDYAFAKTTDHTYLFMKRSACTVDGAGGCEALTRSFNTWERAQSGRPSSSSVPVRHLAPPGAATGWQALARQTG